MGVNTIGLKNDLLAAMDGALDDINGGLLTNPQIRDAFASALANAFEDWIQTADITLQVGDIQVQGTATNQSNVVILNLNDRIS